MHIHILGVCGTFMGGIAVLARQLGYRVTGSDASVYPPMSTQLTEQGIELMEGYDPAHLDPVPDCVVIGNALSRGNPAVEYALNRGLNYTSGPAFLAEHLLQNRWVLAVAGTHGKTTTSSMLAWILEYAGLKPGFLIGGVPGNFSISARLGEAPFFVVEADEYDTAFFDKRSKFVHYRPRTLVMNNLEFDHADIFPDLEAIKRQFHHLVRTVPGNGLIVSNAQDDNLDDVLERGRWTPVEYFGEEDTAGWSARDVAPDGSGFDVWWADAHMGRVAWPLLGRHNVHNALAAIAAARHAGVMPRHAVAALAEFAGVKRRMEQRGVVNGVTVYDDFAHHPTAIQTTLEGLRKRVGDQRIIAVLEPRSNTMRMGVHQQMLAPSLALADEVILYQPADIGWDVSAVASSLGAKAAVFDTVPAIVTHLAGHAQTGDHVLIMSNGGFGGIHAKLIEALKTR
ncbi:MAG: UDP-N-acetylmuramate:L-alanyl-gamma-D-glutamyl-meso-diaminopimelate ligase [Gammaproteobacteria bacterium]|nr:UDP-N-acetylmuramate:L-alanyl-gamma-D-glutamyl-meso-diaminopimelate ligase [Gammaproteobacteria bacterium]